VADIKKTACPVETREQIAAVAATSGGSGRRDHRRGDGQVGGDGVITVEEGEPSASRRNTPRVQFDRATSRRTS
jgi:hypothetical protein